MLGISSSEASAVLKATPQTPTTETPARDEQELSVYKNWVTLTLSGAEAGGAAEEVLGGSSVEFEG